MVQTGEGGDKMKYYTTKEVAEIMQLDVQTIRRKINKGEIKAARIGKEYRVSEEEIQRRRWRMS